MKCSIAHHCKEMLINSTLEHGSSLLRFVDIHLRSNMLSFHLRISMGLFLSFRHFVVYLMVDLLSCCSNQFELHFSYETDGFTFTFDSVIQWRSWLTECLQGTQVQWPKSSLPPLQCLTVGMRRL